MYTKKERNTIYRGVLESYITEQKSFGGICYYLTNYIGRSILFSEFPEMARLKKILVRKHRLDFIEIPYWFPKRITDEPYQPRIDAIRWLIKKSS